MTTRYQREACAFFPETTETVFPRLWRLGWFLLRLLSRPAAGCLPSVSGLHFFRHPSNVTRTHEETDGPSCSDCCLSWALTPLLWSLSVCLGSCPCCSVRVGLPVADSLRFVLENVFIFPSSLQGVVLDTAFPVGSPCVSLSTQACAAPWFQAGGRSEWRLLFPAFGSGSLSAGFTAGVTVGLGVGFFGVILWDVLSFSTCGPCLSPALGGLRPGFSQTPPGRTLLSRGVRGRHPKGPQDCPFHLSADFLSGVQTGCFPIPSSNSLILSSVTFVLMLEPIH